MERGQKISIGSKDYTFKNAAYIDFPDFYKEYYYMGFILVPESFDRGEDDLEHYPYVLFFEVATPGKSFKFGTYNIQDFADFDRLTVSFLEKGVDNKLAKGNFSITRNRGDSFTITIDGVLDNNTPIKGSYTGTFFKEVMNNPSH